MPDTQVWFERAEATSNKLMLLGCVVPRSVSSARAAARRSEESGIPSWQIGARELAETATDEFFIAASAFYRSVPQMADVEASVAACEAAALELTALGVLGAHTAPPTATVLGLRRRKAAGTTFEHLELESRPTLPPSLGAYADLEVAHVRVLRESPRGSERPWLVFVHGAEQGNEMDLRVFRAKHLHHDLGYDVAFPVLPHHGPRRDLGASWPGFDLLGNVATMMRAVSDVRATIDWISREHPGAPITVVGMSLGGPVAALTASLDDRVSSVASIVPMLDAAGTIAHHTQRTGRRGRRLSELLRDDAVRACGSVIDPLTVTPFADVDRRLVIAALNDRMTSVQAAQRLHEHWGGHVAWHHGGHVGQVFARNVKDALDGFLTA